MLIPDSLRQENMPMMVYYLCKAVASGKYSEDEIKENTRSKSAKLRIAERI